MGGRGVAVGKVQPQGVGVIEVWVGGRARCALQTAGTGRGRSMPCGS
jgi:hypothetical protein